MEKNRTQNGVIYIPDISGFTKFVHNTEIDHSQHIIKELIEIILDTNKLNLKLSEIEGDAVLFFRLGDVPKISEIADQTREMFLAFHNYLNVIERDRICQCGACSTASKLTLKFLIHFGEIGISNIKGHEKLIGSSVIVAHRLLKNNIPGSEYLLLTQDYVNSQSKNEISGFLDWDQIGDGKNNYDHIGDISYKYIMLNKLHDILLVVKPAQKPVHYPNPVQAEIHIDAPLNLIYSTIIDLDVRVKWSEGLRSLEFNRDQIHRIGTKHICDLPGGKVKLETVFREFGQEKIEYVERALDSIIFPDATNRMTLRKTGDGTLFTTSFYYKKTKLTGWIKDILFRKKLANSLAKSAANLKNYCESIFMDASR